MYGQNQPSNTGTSTPPTGAAKQPGAKPTTAKGGGNKTVIYAIGIIVAVIVIAAIVLIFSKPQSQNQLYKSISASKAMPMKTFAQLVGTKYNTTNQLNISYSGLVTINAAISGTNVTMKMPLKIDLMKYDSNSRANVAISGMPFVGNMTVAVILNNGKMYSCIESSLLSSLSSNSSSTNSSYQCQPPVATSSLINSTILNNINGSMHFTSVRQSSYNGQGCVLTSGYMDLNSSSINNPNTTSSLSTLSSILPTTNVNATFNMCLSDTYYVPLTMSLHEVINSNSTGGISSGISLAISGTVNLQLNETSLSTSVSPSITTLPGPVVNSSTSGLI